VKKKPKDEPSGTTAPCPVEPDGDVWASPEFQKTAELAKKLMKVPKAEVTELEKKRYKHPKNGIAHAR